MKTYYARVPKLRRYIPTTPNFRCSVCGKPCFIPLVEYRIKVLK